jgi:hypothetical protein
VPSRHVSRSPAVLLVAALVLALLPLGQGRAEAASPFADTHGTIFDDAVAALATRGIVLGCTTDRFCPTDPIQRDQLASMVARALGPPAVDDVGFLDVPPDNVHRDNIGALAATGVVNGCQDGSTFCPDSPTTRDQMASMLDRGFAPPATSARWFSDTSGVHRDAIDRLAAAGITAGCSRAATDFCPRDHVSRGQVALFLARSLELVPRVTPVSLADREAEEAAKREAVLAAEREAIWDALAQCESGGNWSINTGNGYYGGLQFSLSSWRWVGGTGYPHQHSREEQIRRGEMLQALQGWGAWPSCSRQLGLR